MFSAILNFKADALIRDSIELMKGRTIRALVVHVSNQ